VNEFDFGAEGAFFDDYGSLCQYVSGATPPDAAEASEPRPPAPSADTYGTCACNHVESVHVRIPPGRLSREGPNPGCYLCPCSEYRERTRVARAALNCTPGQPSATAPQGCDKPLAPDAKNPYANPKDAFGSMKAPTHLVPAAGIIHESLAMRDGARKYDPYNWRGRAVVASIYISAADRHIKAWFDGEDYDPESGAHNLGHARACLGIVLDATETGNLKDDRPVGFNLRGLLNRVRDRVIGVPSAGVTTEPPVTPAAQQARAEVVQVLKDLHALASSPDVAPAHVTKCGCTQAPCACGPVRNAAMPPRPALIASAIIVSTLSGEPRFFVAQRNDTVRPELDGKWEFPGGHVEAGEDPWQACVREVKEETGFDVAPKQLVMFVPVSVQAVDGLRTYCIAFYACAYRQGFLQLDRKSYRASRWVTRAELGELDLDLIPSVRELLRRSLEFNVPLLPQTACLSLQPREA
jgi:8-oxo-dGTP pyrophosphatase MutT (NUDIX family)